MKRSVRVVQTIFCTVLVLSILLNIFLFLILNRDQKQKKQIGEQLGPSFSSLLGGGNSVRGDFYQALDREEISIETILRGVRELTEMQEAVFYLQALPEYPSQWMAPYQQLNVYHNYMEKMLGELMKSPRSEDGSTLLLAEGSEEGELLRKVYTYFNYLDFISIHARETARSEKWKKDSYEGKISYNFELAPTWEEMMKEYQPKEIEKMLEEEKFLSIFEEYQESIDSDLSWLKSHENNGQ